MFNLLLCLAGALGIALSILAGLTIDAAMRILGQLEHGAPHDEV